MLEEINRTVCDHCSDLLFVYHEDYKRQLELENIKENVFVVGNTIVEPFQYFKNEIFSNPKRNDMILLDIHRPENFNYPLRLQTIFDFANKCSEKYNIPVKMLYFKRLMDMINKEKLNIGDIEIIDLMPYREYLETVYHSRFIISDSGTAQEEPALLNTPVIVPRDFKNTIGEFRPQFAGTEQQDSQEFMNFLLDGLHEDLNRIMKKPHVTKIESKGRDDVLISAESWRRFLLRNDSEIVDHYFGQLKSHVTCMNCKNVSVTFDEYLSLSLLVQVSVTFLFRKK
jgi:UDP-N-acetylglucosamine 2-epimerase